MSVYILLLLALVVSEAANVPDPQPKQDWMQVGKEELARAKNNKPIYGEAKNTILFMGDGMSILSVTAARIYHAQTKKTSFRDARFTFERFPYAAYSMTYGSNVMITDSAAAATGYLTGVKGPYSTIGVNQNAAWTHCHTEKNNEVYSTLYHCAKAGKSTGFVTNTRVTHASPAATYAHTVDRSWESDGNQPEKVRGKCKDIATQLIENGDFLKVMMGGGRGNFMPNTMKDPEYPTKSGNRVDGKDLRQVWQDKQPAGQKYMYIENLDQFNKIDPNNVDRVLALFDPSHMQYEINRNPTPSPNGWNEPSLTEMTEMAIKILKTNEKGYCLFVESGRIDHAHHDANAFKALHETLEFSKAIAKADAMTDIKDTLIITTADHSLPLSFNGYTGINTNILGLVTTIENGTKEAVELGKDGLPYPVLSYANGPPSSFNFHNTNGSVDFRKEKRRDLNIDIDNGAAFDKDYLQYSAIPLRYVTHSGEDVGIYARGPMAHFFHSVHENTYIAHVMRYATCVGEYKDDCAREYNSVSSLSRTTPTTISVIFALLLSLWLLYKH